MRAVIMPIGLNLNFALVQSGQKLSRSSLKLEKSITGHSFFALLLLLRGIIMPIGLNLNFALVQSGQSYPDLL